VGWIIPYKSAKKEDLHLKIVFSTKLNKERRSSLTMILAKFFDLMKDCQDFLTLEQELMRPVAAEGCPFY